MLPPVRVIGRIDRAEQIREAVAADGGRCREEA
jgi:hypothetical protein